MKTKPSNKSIVANFIVTKENIELSTHTIASNTGLRKVQVGQAMHILCRDSDDLFKVRRGVWIYKPAEPVTQELPPKIRVYDAISDGKLHSMTEIAELAGVDRSEVSHLIFEVKRDLRANVSAEYYYKLS